MPDKRRAQAAQATTTMQAIGDLWVHASALCTGAFLLLIATAISNFLRVDVDTGTAPFGDYMGQFALPTIPLMLVLLLMAARNRRAVTIVATIGALFYLGFWFTLPS